MKKRDCNNCIHQKDTYNERVGTLVTSCERWVCKFEPKIDINHTPHCIHTEWKIYNNNEDKDFICSYYPGNRICYADLKCPKYEPEERSMQNNGQCK